MNKSHIPGELVHVVAAFCALQSLRAQPQRFLRRMKGPMKLIAVVICAALLSACGGGGSNGDMATPAPIALSEVEGTWIYSSDNHPTGSTCGLDPSGGIGKRITLTFKGNNFSEVDEVCMMVGTTPVGYGTTYSGAGTFVTGKVYVSSTAAPLQLKELDLTIGQKTVYTSFNISGTTLSVADLTVSGLDGTTAEKRMLGFRTPNLLFTKTTS